MRKADYFLLAKKLRGQYPNGGLEYFLALESEISTIVNGAV